MCNRPLSAEALPTRPDRETGLPRPPHAGFYFRDSGGRRVRYLMWDLGRDRLIWDLTYNGIAHSVIAGGAKTNRQARNILRLPQPEEIR